MSFCVAKSPGAKKKKKTGASAEPVSTATVATTEDGTPQRKKGKSATPVRKNAKLSPEVESAIAEFVKSTTDRSVEEILGEYTDSTYADYSADLMVAPPSDGKRYPDNNAQIIGATRVMLSPGENETTNGFVNANKVTFSNFECPFMLLAVPTEDTFEMFWKAIFQEQCTYLVVCCKLYDPPHHVSPFFWPIETGKFNNYGTMFVNCKKVDHADRATLYTIEVLPDGCSNSLITKLFHISSISTTVTPGDKAPQILRVVRSIQSDKDAPSCVAVACTDGFSRSGTVVAIAVGCQKIAKGQKDFKVSSLLAEMRQQRARAVGARNQYLHIYCSILHYIKCKVPGKHDRVINTFCEQARNIFSALQQRERPAQSTMHSVEPARVTST